jgi:hypothetical protein
VQDGHVLGGPGDPPVPLGRERDVRDARPAHGASIRGPAAATDLAGAAHMRESERDGEGRT